MKAILVIDMSSKCSECGFYYDNKDNKMSCYIDDYIKDCKGTCPLKPMPQKKGISLKEAIGIKCSCYSDGWNDCIDEITGETE